MNEVIIRDLNFKYEKNIIFDNITVNIKDNEFTNIIIKNGKGKTTLIKILAGLLPYKGYININKTILDKNNIAHLRKIVSYVIDFYDIPYINLREKIINKLSYLKFSKKQTTNNIEKIITLFNLEEYIDRPSYITSKSKKAVIEIAYALASFPKVLVLDDTLSYMDELDKLNTVKILKKLTKTEGLTVINLTSSIESFMEGTNIIIVEKCKVIFNEKYSNLYKEKDNLSIKLPFMMDLSNNLSYYNLTEKYYKSAKELINKLWK